MVESIGIEYQTPQLLYAGSNPGLARALELKGYSNDIILLNDQDRQNVTWQSRRGPGHAHAIIDLHDSPPLAEALDWVRLVSISFRPTRLVVILPKFEHALVLQLSRCGANGILIGNPSPAEIIEELNNPPVRSEDYFPDPNYWLRSLRRAAEELYLSDDPIAPLNKLLRIFASHLRMDRASLMLSERTRLRLAAGLGLPADMKTGVVINPSPNSISAWVIENRRARLVEGTCSTDGKNTSPVKNAICVPLIVRDELIGIVNFSSLKHGRTLTPTDLSAAEVFASLLAFTISNNRLHKEILESARLAAIGKTTAGISHCIKNIIQIFKGGMLLLQLNNSREKTETEEKGITMMERAIKRLEDLVFDLLDFSKTREPELSSVQPRELFEKIFELYQLPQYESKYYLDFECAMNGNYELDEPRLQRALINLINNSIDVMPMGGRVLISSREENDEVIFTVSDEGPGVADKDLDSIFEPFFSTKGSKGTGLGLSTVRKFCEENGGHVNASRCQRLGGLKIELHLPAMAGTSKIHSS